MSKDINKLTLLERLKKLEYTNIKPSVITNLDNIDPTDEKWIQIKELYNNKEYQLIGSLINSLISSQTPVFMLSKKVFEEIVKQDMNLKSKNTINSTEYKRMISNLVEVGLVKRIIEPSKFNDKQKRAGLYYLEDDSFRGMITDSEEISKKIIEAYFKFQKLKIDKKVYDQIKGVK